MTAATMVMAPIFTSRRFRPTASNLQKVWAIFRQDAAAPSFAPRRTLTRACRALRRCCAAGPLSDSSDKDREPPRLVCVCGTVRVPGEEGAWALSRGVFRCA